MRGRPDLAQAWRHHKDSAVNRLVGARMDPPRPRDLRAYTAKVVGSDVHYILKNTNTLSAFVDRGREIDIHAWRDDDAVKAALQLATQKWPEGVKVTGTQEYQEKCVRLAVEHGFKINNPELQGAIVQERQRVQQVRDAAIQAERADLEKAVVLASLPGKGAVNDRGDLAREILARFEEKIPRERDRDQGHEL